MSIRFEIDRSAVEGNRGLVAWFRLFGAEFVANAQAIAAGKIEGGTGKYERSFTVELQGGRPPRLLCGNSSPVALYIEEGTDPHEINVKPPGRRSFTNPKRPGALRWFQGAAGGGAGPANLVFHPGPVQHPGTKAQNIIREALEATGDNLRRGTQRAAFFS